MSEGPSIVRLAAVMGERARAEMLTALMRGRALTASELAHAVGITKQTASSHLRQLLQAQLIKCEPQGRHRYFMLTNAEVAQLIESMIGVSAREAPRTGPRDPQLRMARVCYDHLAGEVAVRIFDALEAHRAFAVDGGDLRLTDNGRALLIDFGIDVDQLRTKRRAFCRPCMDWSERRHHLAGAVGASLWTRIQVLGWAYPSSNSRAVRVRPAHHAKLWSLFRDQ